ncbi:hypothetical protein ACNQ62_00305 [Sulfitobacter sp. SBS6]|jgi:hypothetical protein|uniref:hypothetical protein n=1 Tax=Sulfitobacter sp. SBS6 TaxID=3401755 RepID=UPI003AABC1F9
MFQKRAFLKHLWIALFRAKGYEQASQGDTMYSHAELETAISALLVADTEVEQDAVFNDISNNTICPEWSDLIFHSNEFVRPDGSIDIPAAAEKILAYKPIIL